VSTCLNRLASAVIVVPETIRNDYRVGDVFTGLPLSVESARSVQQAAIAIRYHGVKYLPVVDDGCLVGVVAFREEPWPRSDPGVGSDRHAGDGSAGTAGATAVTSSCEEDR
jgi:hypothetical protein